MLPFSGQFSKGFGDKCPYKTSPNSLQIRTLPEVNSTLTIYIGRRFWYNDWPLADESFNNSPGVNPTF